MVTKTINACLFIKTLEIGRQMENNYRQIIFDCSGFGEDIAEITLVHQRSKDEAPFQQGAARDCRNLVIVDLGECTQINNGAFQNDYIMQTVILRRTSVCYLQNAGAFTNTAIRGYGGGSGTIYVPSALVETYKTATNWSSIYNEGHVTFSAIEGSIYEL